MLIESRNENPSTFLGLWFSPDRTGAQERTGPTPNGCFTEESLYYGTAEKTKSSDMRSPGLRRSCEKVGGLVFFGRMLDKITLNAAGKLPPGYNLGPIDWSCFDARCIRLLNVDYDDLVKRTLQEGSDREILEWCFQNGRRPGEEEIEVWNAFVSKYGWRDESSGVLREIKRLRGFAEREDIQTWSIFKPRTEPRKALLYKSQLKKILIMTLGLISDNKFYKIAAA